ncbi:MAG: hypothetical protein FD176_1506 [Rhodospirillaceae bacterium]|nr:MAG: hypothetical protein FD176_1506 [Rhodospirillaceae bacterium]TNC95996.1 MAG: Uncharacterized protein FD119_2087 [Stygiobacter sp.]
MRFVLLHPVAPGLERRYDGPLPPHRGDGLTGSGLLDQLAAESRSQAARRRRALKALPALTDGILHHRSLALADYRHQAVTLLQSGFRSDRVRLKSAASPRGT